MSGLNLISLDLDGVVHPAADKVVINFPPHMPNFQMLVALQAQQRFKWNGVLQEFLAASLAHVPVHHRPKFIVHSTWRIKFTDEQIRFFMPPIVADNMIGLDRLIPSEIRQTASSDEYLYRALEEVDCKNLLVIDDRPEIFESGRTSSWMAKHGGKFVWCRPEAGVTDSTVLHQIADWIERCDQDKLIETELCHGHCAMA